MPLDTHHDLAFHRFSHHRAIRAIKIKNSPNIIIWNFCQNMQNFNTQPNIISPLLFLHWTTTAQPRIYIINNSGSRFSIIVLIFDSLIKVWKFNCFSHLHWKFFATSAYIMLQLYLYLRIPFYFIFCVHHTSYIMHHMYNTVCMILSYILYFN